MEKNASPRMIRAGAMGRFPEVPGQTDCYSICRVTCAIRTARPAISPRLCTIGVPSAATCACYTGNLLRLGEIVVVATRSAVAPRFLASY